MSVSSSYASEAQFGPPSEPISVQEFLQISSRLHFVHDKPAGTSCSRDAQSIHSHWSSLTSERQCEVAEECSVDDLKSSIQNVLEDPFKCAYVMRMHEDNIDAINASAKPGGQMKQKTRKRKRADVLASENIRLTPEVQELRSNLDSIQLKSWPYSVEAAAFVRAQKNSDLNALTKVRRSRLNEPNQSLESSSSLDAIITVSVYNRLSWGSSLNRFSQHAVLSSQTVGDLYETIPCSSNEIPGEDIDAEGELVGYQSFALPPQRGAVICIEGVAYGDGLTDEDYATKLDMQMQKLPQKKRKPVKNGPSMHEVRFAVLTLRINQPYWLLHQGFCEHFLVVDQVRLRHPTHPPSGFPLTLHITPPILDLCQACSRVPASVAIVGDIRLGQSPCKLCGPCWRLMGEPKSGEKVIVVPMPKHELGWL